MGSKRSDIILLPHGETLALYTVHGNDVVFYHDISPDRDALFAIDYLNRSVGIVDQRGKRATIYSLHDDGIERVAPPLTLPAGVAAHSIALRNHTLYAATHTTKNNVEGTLWYIPANISAGEIHKMGMPSSADSFVSEKTMEAILLTGNRLIAVDNIVIPKWNLLYDINDENNPIFLAQLEIPVHTTYEHIYLASIGDDFFALASHGQNHGFESVFLSIFDTTGVTELYCYHSDLNGYLSGDSKGVYTSMAFDGNILYFTTDKGYLGKIDFNAGGHSDRETQIQKRHRQGSSGYPSIEYMKIREPHQVSRVQTIPGKRGFCVELHHNEKGDVISWIGSHGELLETGCFKLGR
jgi:hypothetical protein